jgi:hypothetical protein
VWFGSLRVHGAGGLQESTKPVALRKVPCDSERIVGKAIGNRATKASHAASTADAPANLPGSDEDICFPGTGLQKGPACPDRRTNVETSTPRFPAVAYGVASSDAADRSARDADHEEVLRGPARRR